VAGEAAVEDADQAVAEGAEGLVVGVAGGAAGVVEGARAPGLVLSAENAQRQMASARRLLRAWRARTTRRVPEARVMGDVPA
jgi:hypothetical protein